MTDADRRLVDRFLDMMAAESGASRNTLSAYRSDLTAAAQILSSLGGATADGVSKLGDRKSVV